MTFILFFIGLAGLIVGGELLVRGAVGIAQRFHVPPLVIGLTIVGFGTSMPELLVSVQAALGGSPALAVGNVVGSNIANILLILGLSALIIPVTLNFSSLKRDFIFLIGSTFALWGVLMDGDVTRIEGTVLVLALAVYLWISLWGSREIPETIIPSRPVWQSALLLALGFAGLLLGAKALVTSATEMARAFGVSEAVIGLTIVAIGTSLPEMATGIVAAVKKHPEIAIGNILGSNIFNILGILGITAVITPIPVGSEFSSLDIGLAVASALAFLALAVLPGRVGRLAGGGFLASYGGYLVFLGMS
ncbi:calcium/sodium antiporter [Defluviimonas sp. WL0002]|uniref:Calcium/sodium antiporter n=1 Tax=Albidovulum marisflavi TaxID=2984159 RepID=A0ABT2ZC21_9RHOB|nr:calcium/sodium antiporter [Defluviimonas sp. WL0002]MCV2868600.1 calcium/sodium antiporter [Defluviimonas sp. WL0002]